MLVCRRGVFGVMLECSGLFIDSFDELVSLV